MFFQLGKLSGQSVPPTKIKKIKATSIFENDSTKTVSRSPEEIFMLSHIAPASHGKTIKNDYFLRVKIHYDASCKCDHKTPEISLPMTILPLTH